MNIKWKNDDGSFATEGCSIFFFTSAVLSIASSLVKKRQTEKSAADDEDYLSLVSADAEEHEATLEQLDRETRLAIRDRRREYVRKESEERLENDMLKDEFKMLLDQWPLQISMKRILEKRHQSGKDIMPINVVIGKHSSGDARDPFSQLYNSVVDRVKSILTSLGFADNNIYRFKAGNATTGSAVAPIFAVMNNLPTVVLTPRIDKHQVTIFVNVWSHDSASNFFQKAFSFGCEEAKVGVDPMYRAEKVDEFVAALASVAIILNDAYRLAEGENILLFPEFAKEHDLAKAYPYIVSYAKKEYNAILTGSKVMVNGQSIDAIETLCITGRAGIESIISSALASLS